MVADQIDAASNSRSYVHNEQRLAVTMEFAISFGAWRVALEVGL